MRKFSFIRFVILLITLSSLSFDCGFCGGGKGETVKRDGSVTKIAQKVKKAPGKIKDIYREELGKVEKKVSKPKVKEKIVAGVGVWRVKRRKKEREEEKRISGLLEAEVTEELRGLPTKKLGGLTRFQKTKEKLLKKRQKEDEEIKKITFIEGEETIYREAYKETITTSEDAIREINSLMAKLLKEDFDETEESKGSIREEIAFLRKLENEFKEKKEEPKEETLKERKAREIDELGDLPGKTLFDPESEETLKRESLEIIGGMKERLEKLKAESKEKEEKKKEEERKPTREGLETEIKKLEEGQSKLSKELASRKSVISLQEKKLQLLKNKPEDELTDSQKQAFKLLKDRNEELNKMRGEYTNIDSKIDNLKSQQDELKRKDEEEAKKKVEEEETLAAAAKMFKEAEEEVEKKEKEAKKKVEEAKERQKRIDEIQKNLTRLKGIEALTESDKGRKIREDRIKNFETELVPLKESQEKSLKEVEGDATKEAEKRAKELMAVIGQERKERRDELIAELKEKGVSDKDIRIYADAGLELKKQSERLNSARTKVAALTEERDKLKESVDLRKASLEEEIEAARLTVSKEHIEGIEKGLTEDKVKLGGIEKELNSAEAEQKQIVAGQKEAEEKYTKLEKELNEKLSEGTDVKSVVPVKKEAQERQKELFFKKYKRVVLAGLGLQALQLGLGAGVLGGAGIGIGFAVSGEGEAAGTGGEADFGVPEIEPYNFADYDFEAFYESFTG